MLLRPQRLAKRPLFAIVLRHWLLLVALTLFLLLAAPDLALPGLHYDEALEAATPAARLLYGRPITVVNDGVLRFGGIALPLMVQNHIGALQIYAAMPLIALLGPTTLALRMMTVLVGALTLGGLYAFVLLVYGRMAAGAAAIWLAAFPSFVFWSRQGVFVTNLAPCFAVWACVAGAMCLRRISPRRIPLLLVFSTGLLFGLAVWAKMSTLWIIVGLLAWAVLVVAIERRSRSALRLRARVLFPLAAGFALGILPVILYNVMTGFATLAVVGSSISETYLGTSNRDITANFGIRIGQFGQVLLSGGGEHLAFLGGSHQNWWALASIWLAFGVSSIALIRRRGRGWYRELLAPLLIVLCIIQSCYTISALWHTHFAIAIWLPAMVIGAGVRAFSDNGRQTTDNQQPTTERTYISRVTPRSFAWQNVAIVLVLGAVVLSQLRTYADYMADLRLTGGFASHTTAIQDVSAFLATQSAPVVALDWGMAAQIDYLSGGQTHVDEIFGFSRETPALFATTLQQRFGQHTLFLTHVAGQESFPRRQAFLAAVAAAGLHATTVNVSTRRDGLPMIEVWQVGP